MGVCWWVEESQTCHYRGTTERDWVDSNRQDNWQAPLEALGWYWLEVFLATTVLDVKLLLTWQVGFIYKGWTPHWGKSVENLNILMHVLLSKMASWHKSATPFSWQVGMNWNILNILQLSIGDFEFRLTISGLLLRFSHQIWKYCQERYEQNRILESICLVVLKMTWLRQTVHSRV